MGSPEKAKLFLIPFCLPIELNKQTLSQWQRINFEILLPYEMSVSLMRNKSVKQNVPQKLIFHILITLYINNQAITFQNQTKF